MNELDVLALVEALEKALRAERERQLNEGTVIEATTWDAAVVAAAVRIATVVHVGVARPAGLREERALSHMLALVNSAFQAAWRQA